MTDPDADVLRPFTVPITEPLALLTNAALTGIRDLLADTTNTEPNPECLHFRQSAELGPEDDPVSERRRALLAMSVTAANDMWQNALDLVAAVAHDVTRTPPPVWSPLALARGVLEASLLARYLMDPSISAHKRLARVAGVWFTDAQYQGRTAKAWGEEQPPGDSLLDYVRNAMVECQITDKLDKNGKPCGFVVDGTDAPFDMNITTEAKAALPSWMPEPYRLSSGAAHSRPWVIGRGTTLAAGTGLSFVGEAATVVASVMLVTGSLGAAHEAWNATFSLGRDRIATELHNRTVAYLNAATLIAHPPKD